jgi:phage shock protein A
MAGLFQKINTLLKARIDSFLEEDLHLTRRPDSETLLSASRLGKDVDREISALRQRIEDALNYEDELQEKIEALRQEAADADAQADQALVDGEEDVARQAVEHMRRLDQQAAMLEADLVQHRRTTAEFIERVNVMEGLIAEARRQQESEEGMAAPSETLEHVIQTAQRDAESPDQGEPVRVVVHPAEAKPERNVVDAAAPPVDDDLAARRARLARRNPQQEENPDDALHPRG